MGTQSLLCFFFSILLSISSLLGGEKGLTKKTTLKHNYKGKVQPSRLKDITHFVGVRENQLVGYGLVVGLNNTGDTLASSPQTRESLVGMLERLGVNIRDSVVPSGKNVAAVMVTATLPAFARPGTKIDVVVSALGNAKDLKGGTLLVTPLLGADGEVYAVAQGSMTVSGFNVQGRATQVTKGVPTSGKIPNGAIVEKQIDFHLNHLKHLILNLNNPDFTTARRIQKSINKYFNKNIAEAIDSHSVRIDADLKGEMTLIDLMTKIEQLEVKPDQVAKIVIDEQSGIIVISHSVRVNPVAVIQGNISVKIMEKPDVYMPNPFTNVVSGGPTNLTPVANQSQVVAIEDYKNQLAALDKLKELRETAVNDQYNTQIEALERAFPDDTEKRQMMVQQREGALKQVVEEYKRSIERLKQESYLKQSNPNLTSVQQATVVDNTEIEVKEEKGRFTLLESGASLEEFVDALNLIGATPSDFIAIFQSIKAVGALQADIVVM